MDKLRALNYFKRVAELGSFTHAASELDVPASSVSRRISDLETQLGIELFKRSTRKVQLTELGRLYYEMITQSLASIAQADELISQTLGAPSGLLRISTTPGYGEEILWPVLNEFQQTYPNITLDLHFSDELTVFSQDTIDIAIRSGQAPNERVIAKKVASNDFKLVANPSYLKQINKTSFSPSDIEQSHTLQYRTPHGLLPWYSQDQTSKVWQPLSLNPIITSDNGRTLLNATLRGRGIACLPNWGIKPYLQTGELVEVKSTAPINVSQGQEIGLYLLYPKGKYQLPKVKLCVDYLLAQLPRD